MCNLNAEKNINAFIEAFAVKWKVEMEALGVQPYLTTYVFLIALAAEAGHTLEMRRKRKRDSDSEMHIVNRKEKEDDGRSLLKNETGRSQRRMEHRRED